MQNWSASNLAMLKRKNAAYGLSLKLQVPRRRWLDGKDRWKSYDVKCVSGKARFDL